jgi:nitric oxide reductase NorD protein
MTFQEYYRNTRRLIAEQKPALLRSFDEITALLSSAGAASPELMEAANRLTLASEFQYFSPEWILLALRRGELPAVARICAALAGSRTGSAFIDAYPACVFPVAELEDGLEQLERSGREAGVTVHAVVRFVLAQKEAGSADRLLNAFLVILRASPEAMIEVYNLMHSRLRKLRPSLMERWLLRGVDLISSQRVEEGVDFLRLRSRESRWMLGIKSVVLGDIRRSLRIYATSLAGRSMSIHPLEVSSAEMKIPYADGKSIFLPEAVNLYREREKNERVYSALAAMQAASISMGSFGLRLDALDFLNDIRDRYATVLPDIMDNIRRQYEARSKTIRERPSGEVEIVFRGGRTITVLETPMERFFYMFPAPDLARELFRVAENTRIRAALSRRYPGLEEDFRLMTPGMPRLWDPVAAAKAKREEQFHLLLAGIVQLSVQRGLSGGLSGGIQTTMLHIREALSLVERHDATVADSARACFMMFNQLYERYPVIIYCQRGDIREDFDSPVHPAYAPELVLDASPELLPEMASGRIETDTRQDGAAVDLTSMAVQDKKREDLRSLLMSGEVKVYRYPEYDARRGEYRPKHCTLYERVLASGKSESVQLILRRYERLHKRIKKRFLMLQPDELEISRRWEQGEDINMGDAFDFLTDLSRGESRDQKIFTRKHRNLRDIAVGVLIDSSSSTNAEVGAMSVLDIEKAAVLLLGNALSAIGDVFGIFSFFSRGRREVNFNLVKDFDEAWGDRTRSRISSIEASDSNRDGCAIRHLSARLRERREKTRLLLMLSDGIPADPGYGGRDGAETSQYAIEDTRKALLDARRDGIHTWCITIDKEAKEYIPRLYGDFRYSILDEVEQLPERLSKLYLRITR